MIYKINPFAYENGKHNLRYPDDFPLLWKANNEKFPVVRKFVAKYDLLNGFWEIETILTGESLENACKTFQSKIHPSDTYFCI